LNPARTNLQLYRSIQFLFRRQFNEVI
jgi:hypothetical protein